MLDGSTAVNCWSKVGNGIVSERFHGSLSAKCVVQDIQYPLGLRLARPRLPQISLATRDLSRREDAICSILYYVR